MLKKKIQEKKEERKLTLEDVTMMEVFRKTVTENLIAELGEEVKYCLENESLACMGLFLLGLILGDGNPDLKHKEIIRLKRRIRKFTRDFMERLGDRTLKNFEAHEELYTQILIKGIFHGQQNALMDSNDGTPWEHSMN